MATYRNALEAAYLESMHIDSDEGLFIESVLDTWSKRQPLVLIDANIIHMRAMMTEAGATKCLELFDAAVRGMRVMA